MITSSEILNDCCSLCYLFQLREDTKTGVYVENLSEFEVETVADILKLLSQVCLPSDSGIFLAQCILTQMPNYASNSLYMWQYVFYCTKLLLVAIGFCE